jgi:hypothetical protein
MVIYTTNLDLTLQSRDSRKRNEERREEDKDKENGDRVGYEEWDSISFSAVFISRATFALLPRDVLRVFELH